MGLEEGRQRFQSIDPGLRFFHIARTDRGGRVTRRREKAAVVGEGNALARIGVLFNAEAQQIVQHGIANPVILIECRRIYGVQTGQKALMGLLISRKALRRHVLPLAKGIQVSGPRASGRIVFGPEGFVVGDQVRKGVVLCMGRACGQPGRRQKGAGQQKCAHGYLPSYPRIGSTVCV